jgi:dimethylaniline monooxygenase (N-oxide forming)
VIADSPAGIFDYSDLSMKDIINVKEWADIPAEKVAEYLERYAEKFRLRERCMLGTKVLQAAKSEDGREWNVEVKKPSLDGNNDKEILVCDKLIVATGLFSAPAWPDIDFSCFEGPVMHSRDVGLRYKELLEERHKEIVVVGGNKSAVDVINMCALAGKVVHWLIREEGNGATMLFEVRRRGIHGAVFANGRWSSIPSPSIMSLDNFWYRFLHSGKSKLGMWLMKTYFKKGTAAAFGNIEKLSENRKKLAPKAPE